MSRIAYFGPRGTFTEQAARVLAPGEELIPVETIRQAMTAVREGAADAACVPIENSVEGVVPATLDALSESAPLVAVAETILPIHFSVLTRPGNPEIRTVASHPHALAQVREWLDANLPGANAVASSSTSAAAVGVLEGDFDAAVCAPVAVEHYALDVLATEVADVTDAATRFLLVRRPGELPEPTGADRTSVVAAAANRTGTLAELLTELASRGINLTRLDARPTRSNFGEYRFFIDFEGHVAEPRVLDALTALRRHCRNLRFLGSHPRADGVPTTIEPGFGNDDFLEAAAWADAVRKGAQA
ncbi:prephenate dehydratase [Amycolatopsis mediterranei S699]|uniref:Prephenate dehydratase n=2 Tax=Amycolatopsis mediterranei TaxID=33910 RepID=A0A0H3CVQ3_AMYMU|nr:prephenate dehydratase [Amycolatopsis mediterranei]ADJ42004.1 prephenate dehydratase [Amycolatopsis mediterranei U32]AEK38679.1 prephenate dehydratase [Amycolatopsis mediterranei S699]AFO73714.1 prephenate dehydratase [Amycolatopsis mediterranei S699]AGT80843.1 prephenate dehydratase [Amycolatopsis mediterranei RB]KDO08836.1 prephenate dehydratase [Amycolatopsis mediterranei]